MNGGGNCPLFFHKGGLSLALVKNIDARSPAHNIIKAGDRILSINGNKIEDVLDYKFYSYDARLMLEIEAPDKTKRSIAIKKREGEDLGLDFETYLMDESRSCQNRCVFCFIDQLPPNVRETLLFKDDDARLSFLLGNYITLTNLTNSEIERIINFRISPINISVHTTNSELRIKMLRNKNGGELMDIMRRFYDAGISMNCQIVCCPGMNDGEELRRSLNDLKVLWPQVASVSVVPVGITKYRDSLYPLTPVNGEKAAEILNITDAYGDKCLEELGTRLFYCADELYLKAGREIPPEDYYEDYPQIENGVGMMRSLEEEFKAALKLMDSASSEPFSIATGKAAEGYITKLVKLSQEKSENINCKVYAIKNEFFGDTVDVSGLVSGGDLVSQLKGKELGKRLLIPASMLRHGGDVFLDDLPLEEAEKALSVPITTVPNDGFELAEAIFNVKEVF
jgi:putative radical SAM enzyme (TIGR03279 family)